MAKTVLITGASTGIGLATAKLFQQRGWNVVATMRSPEKTSSLTDLDNTLCLPLDVTDPDSIAQAVTKALEKFSAIEVLVNNAGYALLGAFEACTPEQIDQRLWVDGSHQSRVASLSRTAIGHYY